MAGKMLVDGKAVSKAPVKAPVKAPIKAPAKAVSKGSSVIDNYNYNKKTPTPAPVAKKPVTPAPLNRPNYSVASKTSGLPMNEHIAQYGAPGPTASWQAAQVPSGNYPQTTQYDSASSFVGEEPVVDPAEVARQAAARAAVDYKVDPEYLAAKGAYDNVYDQLMATINRENAVYDADLVKANENMGWRGADKGGWDFQNGDTAAGRGMKNLTDDYAARGMLRGSGFGEAQNSFQTSLQKQLDQLTAQQNEYKGAQTEKLTQADTSRNQSVNMAAAQALARLTQLYTGA